MAIGRHCLIAVNTGNVHTGGMLRAEFATGPGFLAHACRPLPVFKVMS